LLQIDECLERNSFPPKDFRHMVDFGEDGETIKTVGWAGLPPLFTPEVHRWDARTWNG
jgi:hypothetical protein